MGKLTALKVKNLKEPGRYTDGDGLMLVVDKSEAKRWVLRMVVRGKRRDIGLGSVNDISLADARNTTHEMRRIAKSGGDPVAERREALETVPSFEEVARMVHAEHRPSWKNAKHAAQWLSTLETYAFPKIRRVPVDQIGSGEIHCVLAPIWLKVPETARRVRQRIGTVLDYAFAKGWREHEAPMRAVSRGLPKQSKSKNHFAAIKWADLPDFYANMESILSTSDVVRDAIWFAILTAARSGEVRGARWSEIDIEAKTWTIPADRMKAGIVHRVPLCGSAVSIIESLKVQWEKTDSDALVFPGQRDGRPLSDMSLTMPIRRAKLNFTVHGFRSTFRDWCAEATMTPREVAEAALAHTNRNTVEAAYARTDHLDRRRSLMAQWDDFICGRTSKIIPLKSIVGS